MAWRSRRGGSETPWRRREVPGDYAVLLRPVADGGTDSASGEFLDYTAVLHGLIQGQL